jgi:hypothetical protein
MDLRLSPEKTLVTHIEGLDFLGWRIPPVETLAGRSGPTLPHQRDPPGHRRAQAAGSGIPAGHHVRRFYLFLAKQGRSTLGAAIRRESVLTQANLSWVHNSPRA